MWINRKGTGKERKNKRSSEEWVEQSHVDGTPTHFADCLISSCACIIRTISVETKREELAGWSFGLRRNEQKRGRTENNVTTR